MNMFGNWEYKVEKYVCDTFATFGLRLNAFPTDWIAEK